MKCYFCKEPITEAMRTFVEARSPREKDGFRDLCLGCYKIKKKAEGKVYRFILPITEEQRCPYCGSPLSDEDVSRDGEALWCHDCSQRVEYVDAWESRS